MSSFVLSLLCLLLLCHQIGADHSCLVTDKETGVNEVKECPKETHSQVYCVSRMLRSNKESFGCYDEAKLSKLGINDDGCILTLGMWICVCKGDKCNENKEALRNPQWKTCEPKGAEKVYCKSQKDLCHVKKDEDDSGLAPGCLNVGYAVRECGINAKSPESKKCITTVEGNRVISRDCCCKEGPECEWAPLKCYDSELKAAKTCEWNQFCVTYRPFTTNTEEKAFSGCQNPGKYSIGATDVLGKHIPYVRATTDKTGTYYACTTDNCNEKPPKRLLCHQTSRKGPTKLCGEGETCNINVLYKDNAIDTSCVNNGCKEYKEQGAGVKCHVTAEFRLECCCSTDLCNVEPHKLLKGESLKEYNEAHGIKTEGTNEKNSGSGGGGSTTEQEKTSEKKEGSDDTETSQNKKGSKEQSKFPGGNSAEEDTQETNEKKKPPGGGAAWDKAAQTSLVTAILILFVI